MRGLNQNVMDVRRSNSIAMEHIKTEEHWPNNLVSTWGMQSIHVFAEKKSKLPGRAVHSEYIVYNSINQYICVNHLMYYLFVLCSRR